MKPIIVSAILSSGGTVPALISSGGTVLGALIAAWGVRSAARGGDGRQTTQAGTPKEPRSPRTPLAEERQSQEFEREIVREKQRGRLAIVLMFILLAVVLVSLWYVLTASSPSGAQIANITGVISSLLLPLVGLLGVVTGFYYGAQTERLKRNGDDRE